MTKTSMEKSPLTENFHHVGLIVHDADRVAEYYESLGIGSFEPFAVDDINKAVDEMIRRGMNIVYQSKFKNGGAAAYLESDKLGGIMLELFQRPNEYVARKKK